MAHENMAAIGSLEPRAVWEFFAGLAGVPRPSKKEGRVREHVRSVAQQRGLTVREDAAGNLLIEVPASAGCESAPVVVLQGHLDMVCEKNAGTAHDFDNDPIRLVLDRDADSDEAVVRADGTTLGADNGIGVALAFAAATSLEVTHGPLEILCTVDEEAGMTGAKALSPGFFQGKTLLNLDSEEDDVIYIGCAGGCDSKLNWSFAVSPVPADAEWVRVSVAGLRGGHSGGDIHLNRASAVRLLARVLNEYPGIRLVGIRGGSLRNAIAREAEAVVAGPAGIAETLASTAARVQEEIVRAGGEARCAIQADRSAAQSPAVALTQDDTQRLLSALVALPHGVLALVPEMPGLVLASNNVGTVVSQPGAADGSLEVNVGCLSRSSSLAHVQRVVRQIAAVGRLAGADVASGNAYPGWQPNVNSPLLALCRKVYEDQFGSAPRVTAIHAGLECGIIGDRMGGGLDMVSIGPRIRGAHSPDERVYVDSVRKSWQFLTAILATLAGHGPLSL